MGGHPRGTATARHGSSTREQHRRARQPHPDPHQGRRPVAARRPGRRPDLAGRDGCHAPHRRRCLNGRRAGPSRCPVRPVRRPRHRRCAGRRRCHRRGGTRLRRHRDRCPDRRRDLRVRVGDHASLTDPRGDRARGGITQRPSAVGIRPCACSGQRFEVGKTGTGVGYPAEFSSRHPTAPAPRLAHAADSHGISDRRARPRPGPPPRHPRRGRLGRRRKRCSGLVDPGPRSESGCRHLVDSNRTRRGSDRDVGEQSRQRRRSCGECNDPTGARRVRHHARRRPRPRG